MGASKDFQFVKAFFKNDVGQPLELSPSQELLFSSIARRISPDKKKTRNIQVIAFTRFGKSMTTAVGVLTRVSTYPEKWAIVAPSVAKAKIIMSYVIQHAFDNEYFIKKLTIEEGESLERLRRERSKNRLTFKIASGGFGEVFILSAQGKAHENPLDALMGFGSPNIILDESSLLDDTHYAGVLRMLGDLPDPFLLEIGNPFRRNHFLTTASDPAYYHLLIDYQKGLAEGRITQEQVERMRTKKFFDILYECKFPPPGAIDSEGWIPLLTEEEFTAASRTIHPQGKKRLGVDVGEGGDASVYIIRFDNYAYIKHTDHDSDIMSTTGKIRRFAEEEFISPENVFVDATGIGAGVVDRLNEMGFPVTGIKNAMKAFTPDNFVNIKTECFWRLRDWLRGGGCLEPNENFAELLEEKYRIVDSTGKIQIVPKDVLRQWGIPSPNVAEALALTFAYSELVETYADDQPYYSRRAGVGT